MEKNLVLSADAWRMVDEQTGEIREGVTVWFVNDYRQSEAGMEGLKPSKVTCEKSLMPDLQGKLPGIFEFSYSTKPGKDGKPTVVIVGAKHVSEIDIFGTSKPSLKQA